MRSTGRHDTVIRDNEFDVAGLNFEMNTPMEPNLEEFRRAVFAVVSQLFEQRRPSLPASYAVSRLRREALQPASLARSFNARGWSFDPEIRVCLQPFCGLC